MIRMTEEPHAMEPEEGKHRVYEFSNGWMLSAIKTSFSYGGEIGLWEICLLDDKRNEVTTDVFHNVVDEYVGFVNDQELEGFVQRADSYCNEHMKRAVVTS